MVARKTNGTPQWRLESANARSRAHHGSRRSQQFPHASSLGFKEPRIHSGSVLGYCPTRWESEVALNETRGRGIAVAA